MSNNKNRIKLFGNDTCKEIKEYICPHCHEYLIMNPRQYANHIRWCKCNPKYNEIKEKTTKHLKESNYKYYENKIGKIKDFNVVCSTCGKHFTIQEHKYKFDPNKKYYCSRSCANTHKRTQESKDKIRKIIMEKYSIEKPFCVDNKYYKYNLICRNCNNSFYTDNKDRLYCCRNCDIEYRNKKYIDNISTSKNNKNLLELYRRECVFKFGISSYPEEFDFDLIKENGWYKAKNHGNNLYGVSRDHMYSVKEGFNNKIDPYLISHPVNCQLMIHTDNESKNNKCSISLDELKERVKNWNIKYGEYPNRINYDLLIKIGIITEYR